MDLFEASLKERMAHDQPLAARMRPRNLDEFIGQEHILGPGRLLRRAIQADRLSSLIFYGPPGTGKTTLALVIANTTRSHFITINAVLAGVADIRNSIDEAQERRKLHDQRTLLFIDEVHRFNRAQQDALLPWVENGTVVLIGATTENPYFTVNRPVLSRSRIFQLKALEEPALHRVVAQTLADPRGYASKKVKIAADALDHLVNIANGDARALLNALELAVETTEADKRGHIRIDLQVAEESIQQRAVLYDKEGDYHFDTISAFIKSMRGSDPDATLYWLARMVYAGEDPRFLFRRMLVFASEDVGLADPTAVQVVAAAAESFERVGLPEGRFPLAQAALHLATAPKSNSTLAFFDALDAVKKEREAEVPNQLKDASRDSEGFGHGANYLYPHAYREHWVAQQYLPDTLQGRVFYQPSDQGYEKELASQVQKRREAQLAAAIEGDNASPEILSFSPPDPQRDQWLKRAASEDSAQLNRLRQRLFAALPLQRHHLVLDLAAATGLLTWEALRQVPEGGVWAVCTDRTAAIGLQEMAHHLPEIEQPQILQGPLQSLPKMLQNRKEDIRFDAIIGRNALGNQPEKEAIIQSLAALAAADCSVRLVETAHHRAQRLYRLADYGLDQGLFDRLVQAEEQIYLTSSSSALHWDADELAAWFEAAGFSDVICEIDEQHLQRRITRQQLGHWFNSGGDKHPTYAWHLSHSLEADEIKQIRKALEKALINRDVPWLSTSVYLRAQGAAP
jgi:putative ATPase